MTPRGRKHLLKPLVLMLAALALEGCISPSADSVGRYTAPIGGSPVISNETPYSAALRCMSRHCQPASGPHRGGPDRRLYRQDRSRWLGPQGDGGRRPDGDDRAVQIRRPYGGALRHLGRRNGTQIRQQQADRRRQESQGRGLPQDHGGLDSRLRLLHRGRHHRTELQHPLRECQRHRRRHRHQRHHRHPGRQPSM